MCVYTLQSDRIVDSTGACLAVASPPSRDNSVLTTMQSFEEVSPQHSLIAQFSRILRCSHPELQKRANRANQLVLFFLAGANFWEKHAKNRQKHAKTGEKQAFFWC